MRVLKEKHSVSRKRKFLNTEPANPSSVEIPDYFAKRALRRRIFGSVLLVCFSPIVLSTMILVRLTSRGPAIFRQLRVGKDGQLFTVYKLRTMYEDAEKLTGPTWAKPKDSRITPVGRMLRFLHLDELPQLFNVMRGEMDLVGPRPERPEIIERDQLLELIPGYAVRHAVLPGVTGLAQINLPADQTIDCVHRKVALDIEYIRTASRNLDYRILLCTALRMLGVRHGIAVRWLKLNRNSNSRIEGISAATGTLPAIKSSQNGRSASNGHSIKYVELANLSKLNGLVAIDVSERFQEEACCDEDGSKSIEAVVRSHPH